MAKSKSKELDPMNWKKNLAKLATEEGAREVAGSARNVIKTKGGKFTYKGMPLPMPMKAVVVHSAYENAYYTEAYDADSPTPPGCFALSMQAGDMAPHDSSPEKQHENCTTCEQNQFGSRSKGRGKACQNRRRLILISADADLTPAYLADCDMAMLSLSPTALTGWGTYVNKLTKVVGAPPYACITEFDIVDNEKGGGYHVTSKFVELLEPKQVAAIQARRTEAESIMMAPYDVSGYGAEKAPKKSGKVSKAGKKAKRGF